MGVVGNVIHGSLIQFGPVAASICVACKQSTIWYQGKPIYPREAAIPPASENMPLKVREIYDEAGRVLVDSPRSAAALLRLALQILINELGEEGENINKDIASLVKKGLPTQIQQAMDVLRIIGNNAVHPGTITFDDDPSIAAKLFITINLIVEVMITQPKDIAKLYENLPETSLDAIKRRDT